MEHDHVWDRNHKSKCSIAKTLEPNKGIQVKCLPRPRHWLF